MMQWLVLWKTWVDEKVTTPWPFTLVENTQEFRLRGMRSVQSVPDDTVSSIYLSMDPRTIARFEENHIHGVVLSCMISAPDQASAEASVKGCFPDAEFVGCAPIPGHMVDRVRSHIR